jgi:membrane-associated phospholipid phosphatase
MKRRTLGLAPRGNIDHVSAQQRPPASGVEAREVAGARRFGVRIVVALAGVVLAAVPFTVLGIVVHTQGTSANRLDLGVADRLHTFVAGSPGLTQSLRVISAVLAPDTFRVLLALVAVTLVRRAPRLAIWIAVTVVGEVLLDVTLKWAFDRARPVFVHPLARAPGASFPSGHAFGSFVGCAVLLLVALPLLHTAGRVAAIAAASVIVIAVGFARVGLGVHYVTDVVGGWLLAVAWVAVTAAAFQSWRADIGLRRAHVATEGVEPELPAEAARESSG